MAEESIVRLISELIRATGLVIIAAIAVPVLKFCVQRWYDVRKMELEYPEED